MSNKITKSSGNVFFDIGFSIEEAESLQMRSHLMMAISEHIKENNLTQAQAAKVLRVSQPHINKIYDGKIGLFSIDKLVLVLARIGKHVDVIVSDKTT